MKSKRYTCKIVRVDHNVSCCRSNAAQAGPNEETLVEPDDNVAGSCTQEDRSGLSDMVA